MSSHSDCSLAANIPAIALELLGQPNRALSRCTQWRYGRQGSLSIDLARGVWRDFETGDGGGVLDLVARVRGGSRTDAVAWLQGRGWRDGGGMFARHRPASTRKTGGIVQVERADSERRSTGSERVEAEGPARALALWRASLPPEDTPIAAYFSGRGLSLPADPGRVLRWHPSCPFGSERLPAMLALIRNVRTDEPQGVHRTPLTLKGERARRADGEKRAKMMLGAAAGGAIKLSADSMVACGLAIAEGVETGLAALQRAPWLPTWAALSAGGVAGFPVLAGIERLTVYADNDLKPDGRNPGLEAARECARRWAAAERWATVEFLRGGGDFADLALPPGLP